MTNVTPRPGPGPSAPYAAISSWSAEIFIPYALLNPLITKPPSPGTSWKGNFCRLDYDSGKMIKWAWGPVEKSYHEYWRFRTLVFE